MATKPAEVPGWKPPTSDQEFVFKDIESLPDWCDKSWAGFNNGPALSVPTGDIYGNGAWTTKYAHPGDTVKFVAPTPSKAGHFVVIEGEPAKVGDVTKYPAQESGAALEDQIKGDTLAVDDLSTDAKAQVAGRTPAMKPLVEQGS